MARSKIHEIRRGLIIVKIGCRRTKTGVRHSIAIRRLLRDGEVWKSSTRFNPPDIPLVRLVLDEALTWIVSQNLKSN